MCRRTGVPIQYVMFITWPWGSFMADLFREEAPKGYKGVGTQVTMLFLAYTKFLSMTQLIMIKLNARRFDPEVFVNCVRGKGVR